MNLLKSNLVKDCSAKIAIKNGNLDEKTFICKVDNCKQSKYCKYHISRIYKTDCFGFRDTVKGIDCKALKQIDCQGCAFYKPKRTTQNV